MLTGRLRSAQLLVHLSGTAVVGSRLCGSGPSIAALWHWNGLKTVMPIETVIVCGRLCEDRLACFTLHLLVRVFEVFTALYLTLSQNYASLALRRSEL